MSFQRLLLSRAPANYERARDSIAALITQNGGEYLVRLGAQPPAAKLLDRSLTDEMDGWTGQERTQEDIEFLQTKFTEAVEEIGGKVCRVCFIKTRWLISMKAIRPSHCEDWSSASVNTSTNPASRYLPHARSTVRCGRQRRQWQVYHSRRTHARRAR